MKRYESDIEDGLTRGTRYFISVHGIRVASLPVEDYRTTWLGLGVPAAEIDRVAAFSERWGGLALPPSPCYDGGPRCFSPDVPETDESGGWWFEAGDQRSAVPYGFFIGPNDEFGICGGDDEWVPLHGTVEGWVESLALAHHARLWAEKVTRVKGDEVHSIDLDGFEPVPEVVGLADTWWRGKDSLVAIYQGEAECLAAPKCRTALIFSGLDKWGLRS